MSAKTAAKIAFGVVVLVLVVVAGAFASGGLFMLFCKKWPDDVSCFTWFQYWHHYGDVAWYKKKLVVAAILGYGVCGGLPAFLIYQASRDRRELHGSARFATRSEIASAGLMGDTGIVVGKLGDRYLMFEGQQFVILAAPTRSGKGVGIVIPNLLSWPDSVVVLDIKQENFDVTSGFRKKYGHEVYLVNPFADDGRTQRWNPLSYIRRDALFCKDDAMDIGYILFPDGKDEKENFWNANARNLFVGLTLYLIETPGSLVTMGEVLRQSSGNGRPLSEYLAEIKTQRQQSEMPLSKQCIDALNMFLSIKSENTSSGVLSTFQARMSIFSSTLVDAATSENDFDLRDVRKRRMSIYLGISPANLPKASMLLNLFFSQLIKENLSELPQQNPDLRYQCLLLMDEFTAMGRIDQINKAVSYMAGYNLRLFPIIQSLSQLDSTYGRDDARTLVTNHAMQIIYAPRQQRDADEAEKMLGYQTVKGRSTSKQYSSGPQARGSHSESESDQRRALLLAQEIKEIGQWKEIISLENLKPFIADKIRYYDDPVFTARLLPAVSIDKIDLDVYLARLEQRVRETTPADIASGVDLTKLAADLSTISPVDESGMDEEAAKRFADEFFSLFAESKTEVEGEYFDSELTQPDEEPEVSADEKIGTFAISVLSPSFEESGIEQADAEISDNINSIELIDLSVLDRLEKEEV